jgi:peptidoglycan/xylan/chitin deacetylase (PgdA/CDA1 family)
MHDWLRALPTEHDTQREISALCTRYDVDETPIARELCMSWEELKAFADDSLVTIGAHTITHCNLARQSEETASFELAESRARIEAAVQRPVLHFAYPYGDRIAAGRREFALAKVAGFKTAVTTRPGMIFPESAEHLTALQRVSINGNYQDARILPVLTSGAATAMWNGFRRIDAACLSSCARRDGGPLPAHHTSLLAPKTGGKAMEAACSRICFRLTAASRW